MISTTLSCAGPKQEAKLSSVHRINPLCSGNPLISTFANSEDPDEMQHNAAFHQTAIIMLHFIRGYTVCIGKNDLQTKEYNVVFF